MGDFRASVKVELRIYDVEDSVDMWINYDGLAGEVLGVDDRVIVFFRDVFERAYPRYLTDLNQIGMEQSKRELEERERAELQRLKAKYPD